MLSLVSVSEGSSFVVHGLLTAVASRGAQALGEQRQELWPVGLDAPQRVELNLCPLHQQPDSYLLHHQGSLVSPNFNVVSIKKKN